MKAAARLRATAVALGVAIAIAGCSSGPTESAGADSVASTVMSSASSVPSATNSDAGAGGGQSGTQTPAASRQLPDFADGSAEYPYYSFRMPRGQIQCRVVDGTLACQTGEHGHTVATEALSGFYPPDVEQGNTNRFGYFQSGPKPCATVIQGD